MSWVPEFKIYASNGATLIYTFPRVTDCNEPQDPSQSIIHTTPRSKGGIIIDAGEEMWDLNIEFVLLGDGYADIMSQVDTLMTTIPKHTKMVFKAPRTESSTQDYNVIRTESIQLLETNNAPKTTFQKIRMSFMANSW